MQVTLDVFSGRPNPRWELTQRQTDELLDRFAGRAMPAIHEIEPKLGYRGHIIKAGPADNPARMGLPYTFRVPTRSDESDLDDELWLVSTADSAVEDDLGGHVLDELESTRSTARRSQQSERTQPIPPTPGEPAASGPSDSGCVPINFPFIPWFWNQLSVLQYNNCYNYATNYRSNSFAQPGRFSGHPFAVLSCDEVSESAVHDGYKRRCSGLVKEVALVIWPGFDFHWYRNHPEGFWGHKIGPTPATNLDNMNDVITAEITPAACARGPYTDFCAFIYPPLWLRVS